MPTSPPQRQNLHLARWLLVGIIATLVWGGWRAYAFRSALAEAKALGWDVGYTDPAEAIRKNWKAAFKKATWLSGVTDLGIPTSKSFEQHLSIIHRLNPKALIVEDTEDGGTLHDLSALIGFTRLEFVSVAGNTGLTNVDALKHLPALQWVDLTDCTGLLNVDAFQNLSALQQTHLDGCTGLTNVDGLKNLAALKAVSLFGCTGLTLENVSALKAALPNAQISGP